MKFTVLREELTKALDQAKRVVLKTPLRPILACFLLSAKGDRLIISAFDETIAIEIEIDAAIEVNGLFAVPSFLFLPILETLPNVPLVLSVEGDNLVIEHLGGQVQLRGFSGEDFPILPDVTAEQSIEIPRGELTKIWSDLQAMASTNETKALICGINIQQSNGRINFAATNGHALGRISIDSALDCDSATIPISSVKKALPALKGCTDPDVSIDLDSKQCRLTCGNASIMIRLIEGQYPNYPQLIPAVFSKTCITNSAKLAESLNRLLLIKSVVMLEFSEKKIQLSASTVDNNRADEVVSHVSYVGEPIKIAMNPKYMLDGLSMIGVENVMICMNGPTNQMVFKPQSGGISTDDRVWLGMAIQIRE